MSIVEGIDKLMSLEARGTFGRGGGFGRITFGKNYFGYYTKFSGIYTRYNRFGKIYLLKKRFYAGKNPQTPGQQAWRAVFASGMSAWANLTTQEKEFYNKKAKAYKMLGKNLFLSEFLNEQ